MVKVFYKRPCAFHFSLQAALFIDCFPSILIFYGLIFISGQLVHIWWVGMGFHGDRKGGRKFLFITDHDRCQPPDTIF